MVNKWIILIILCAVTLIFSVCPALAEADDSVAEWTVMFYMCGTDLESRFGYASENLADIAGCKPILDYRGSNMMRGDYSLIDDSDKCGLDGVNIVVETGGSKEWHADDLNMSIDPSALQRWHFFFDIEGQSGFILDESLSLQSMADPDILSGFIRWSAENYPAKKYALVLWDHGGGSKSGLFSDELFDNDTLFLNELKTALSDGGVHFECVLLDACMMANIETACAIGDSANWMVASEEVVSGSGTAIGDWLQQLCYIPEMDGEGLGRMICDTTQIKYAQQDDEASREILTWSVIDLTQAQRLAGVFDDIFAEIDRIYIEDPMLLLSLADDFIQAEFYGTGVENQYDLAGIFFSDTESAWDPGLRRRVLLALKDAIVYSVRGSGRSAARGLSFCYAVDFDELELDTYAGNCPSPHYLALLDAMSPWTAPDWVYEQVERLPDIDTIDEYRMKIKKCITPDGIPAFDFVQDGLRQRQESNVIRYKLYKVQETGEVIRIGMMPANYERWSEGGNDACGFVASKPWLWPALDGVTCAFNVLSIDRPGWREILANIDIQINGVNAFLRCSYDDDDDSYTLYGLWDGYDSHTSMFNRNVRSLSQLVGQKISLIYPVHENWVDTGEFIANPEKLKVSRAMGVAEEPLPEGHYRIEYVIYDAFMRPMFMEPIDMYWDGREVIFPDAGAWQGEAELTIPDEYWTSLSFTDTELTAR